MKFSRVDCLANQRKTERTIERTKFSFERLEDRRVMAGELGLRADFFNAASTVFSEASAAVSTEPTLSRIDSNVNFSWGTGAPASGIRANTFAARWTGQVQAIESGVYAFRTSTDDRVRLFVNDQLVVNRWTNGSASAVGSITLEAGQRYDIRMDYFENTGVATASLEWQRPALTTFSVVPSSQLYPFSQPATIRQPGIYVGSWESLDPDTSVVTVDTPTSVTIARSWIRGQTRMGSNGENGLIAVNSFDTSLVVRNSHLHGMRSFVNGAQQAYALNMLNPERLEIENNMIEGTGGIRVLNYEQHPPASAIKILRNQAKNIDGRLEGPDGDLIPWVSRTEIATGNFEWGSFGGSFVAFNALAGQPNVEIAWNEVLNDPFNSTTEDIISFFMSGGTADSPMLVHNNFIRGGYTASPNRKGTTTDGQYEYFWTHTGTGMNLGDNAGGIDVGYVKAFQNQVINTTNAGIGFAGGHHIEVYENRAVSSARLPDGSVSLSNFAGISGWDFYGTGPTLFYANVVRDNVSGWFLSTQEGDLFRNDYEFRTAGPGGLEPSPLNPTNPISGVTTSNNVSLTQTLNTAAENAEATLWRTKLRNAAVTIGTRSTIQYVMPGVLQAENYTQMSGVLNFQSGLGFLDTGDWVRFRNIDFGAGVNRFSVHAATPISGASVQLRLGSPTGSLVSTVDFQPTSDWGAYATRTTTLSLPLTGRRDIFFVFVGAMNIDYFSFSNVAAQANSTAKRQALSTACSPTQNQAATDQVLASGFMPSDLLDIDGQSRKRGVFKP